MRSLPRWLPIVVGTLPLWLAGPGDAAAVPTQPNELTNNLNAPQACQNCHTFMNLPALMNDPAYAPFTTWQGSLMANSARDPVFWAGVAIASQDAQADETTSCIRCHAPKAFLEGREMSIAMDDLTPDDQQGVVCESCHRMMDDGVIGNAQYTIDDMPGAGGVVPRRGPWDYGPLPFNPPHPWINDPFTGSSQLCGVCHDVTTPSERLDDAGAGMGFDFNEQRTYSEWANSDFAVPGADFQSCQDCHMPAVSGVNGCGLFGEAEAHATGGRRHDLVGANRFMLEVLKEVYGQNGTADIPDAIFDNTIARMDESLPTASTLEVMAPASVDLGSGLDLPVTVTNNTGHKLPTGYSEGRVMWLEVIATYNGATVYSSGEFQAGVGPTEDALFRSYRAIADEFATGTVNHLLLNDHWVEDTRIPPAGLTQDIQTDPVTDRYTPLPDGTWPNFDDYTYAFPMADTVVDDTPMDTGDDNLEVTVRLLYLINSPEYIEFLADENMTNDAGMDVAMLFDMLGGAPPLVLGEQTVTIPIDGFFDPSGESTGGVDPTTSGGSTTAAGTDSAGTDSAGQDDDGGDGCGCRTDDGDDHPLGAPLGAMLLLLPAIRRRRRR